MKRKAIAIGACLLVMLLGSEVFSLAWSAALPNLPGGAAYAFWPLSSLPTLSGVAAGTFIARGRFLIPALALWVLGAGFVFGYLYRIQLAALPMSLLDYAAMNLPGLGSSLVATACGLVLGREAFAWWQARQVPDDSSKPMPTRDAG